MKKIVALVLSLVMVLGLATTAFAADPVNTYTGLFTKETTEAGMAADAVAATLKFYKAVDNKVTTKGAYEADGNVAYYTVNDGAQAYAKVESVNDADVIVYSDAAATKVYMYLDAINAVYFGDGAVETNFGKVCGQYDEKDADYDKEATYYTAFKALYVEDKTSAIQLMVNGKLVPVSGPVSIDVVPHKAVSTADKTGKVEAISCSACGVAAAKAANFAAIPENADWFTAGDGSYWYWTATAGTTGTTSSTVQSAQTFDAGIAMYVGMSVMAAAGSAVVIGKKKD